MESKVLSYFYEIPDELLVLMVEHNWGKMEELCMFLSLDIEMARQERLKN